MGIYCHDDQFSPINIRSFTGESEDYLRSTVDAVCNRISHCRDSRSD